MPLRHFAFIKSGKFRLMIYLYSSVTNNREGYYEINLETLLHTADVLHITGVHFSLHQRLLDDKGGILRRKNEFWMKKENYHYSFISAKHHLMPTEI